MARGSAHSFVGLSGEYAVASELTRRGWLATLLPGGAADFDVVAAWPDDQTTIFVQVKTVSPGRTAFQLRSDHETHTAETNQWFVFVRLHADPTLRPTFHIAPRNLVAAILWGVRREAEERGKSVGKWRSFVTPWLGPESEDGWDLMRGPTDESPSSVREQEAGFIRELGRPEDKVFVTAVG